MAPLTRCRADENRVPTDMMVTYYSQRATTGMIISEATSYLPWVSAILIPQGYGLTIKLKGGRKLLMLYIKKMV
nr:hypothetical protein [Francisella halioticida]